MSKEISVRYLTAFVFIFSIAVSLCLAEEEGLEQAKDNICSLIDSGKFNEAKAATDNLVSDFAGEVNLPEARYEIGARYERMSKFDEEKFVFQQIIQNHPDSPFADKARLGISRADVMSLIMAEKYDLARAAIDKMASDFSVNPDLPEDLFWITERYVRLNRFDEAKQNYQRIIQKFPSNRFANKAMLWFSRINATALIESGDFVQAQTAIDKLTADFAGDTDLPMILYWTVEKFEQMNRFDDAKRNYQRIVQNYPENSLVDKVKLNVSWADRAKLGISRADAMSLIVSGNYEGAKAAIDKMSVDFAGNPTLPGALY